MRVRGSEGAGVTVRILELSPTSSQFSDPIITSHLYALTLLDSNINARTA